MRSALDQSFCRVGAIIVVAVAIHQPAPQPAAGSLPAPGTGTAPPVATPTLRPHPEFVADANLFVSRGYSNVRVGVDAYLRDPNVTLYLPDAQYSEIDVSQRINIYIPGGASVVRLSNDPDVSSLGAMASVNFDRNDMILLETALMMHLPVVSLNAARLRAQVLSDPSMGRMRWARVEIRDPRVHGPYAP